MSRCSFLSFNNSSVLKKGPREAIPSETVAPHFFEEWFFGQGGLHPSGIGISETTCDWLPAGKNHM